MQLERILQSLEPVKIPSPSAEQYPTPAAIAAEVIQFALGHSDIAGRSVVDLGCGNGVLAIAAKLSGAARVLGVDADPESVEVSRRNAERSEVEVEWEVADVSSVHERFDTVLMNPPFGAQTRHAGARDLGHLQRFQRAADPAVHQVYNQQHDDAQHDGHQPVHLAWLVEHDRADRERCEPDDARIDAAMDLGKVVYTFVNAPSEPFVERRIETTGSRITDRLEYRFPIPHLFSFHQQDVRTHEVLLYRVEVAKG